MTESLLNLKSHHADKIPNDPTPIRPPSENRKQKSKLKRGLKTLIIGLILVFIAVVVWRANEIKRRAVVTQSVAPEIQPNSQVNLLEEKIESFNALLNDVNFDLSHVTLSINGIKKDLDQLSLSSEAADRRIRQTFEHRITRIDDNLQGFTENVAKLNKKIHQKTKKRIIKPKTVTFNYPLDGMGEWAGTPFINVLVNGQYRLFEIGDSLDSWTLVELNIENGSAIFQHKNGKRIKAHG